MNLYEINQAIENFEFEIDEETGEVKNIEELDQLELDRVEKIENIACYIKNLRAFAGDIKAEEVALKERRETIEKKAERLKEYLSQALNGEKFNTARIAISWRQSTSLEITDKGKLLDWISRTGNDGCLSFKEPTIAKSVVSDLLKSGVDVPGAEIKTSKNIQLK